MGSIVMRNILDHTQRTLTTLLLASGIALAVSSAGAQELTTKDLTPVQRPVAELAPPPPPPSSRPDHRPSGLQITA